MQTKEGKCDKICVTQDKELEETLPFLCTVKIGVKLAQFELTLQINTSTFKFYILISNLKSRFTAYLLTGVISKCTVCCPVECIQNARQIMRFIKGYTVLVSKDPLCYEIIHSTETNFSYLSYLNSCTSTCATKD